MLRGRLPPKYSLDTGGSYKLRKKHAEDQPTSKEKNESISCCDKRTDEYCEHEENAEDQSKTTPHREDPEEPISWSDLDKVGVYALLMFICTGIIVTLTLVTLLYRERLGISTESEQRFMDFISETLFF